ncbi:MAG TPA: hypothetical protein VK283_08640 [Acidimicrobiales bacterium]|nr:hypothetical protein [Acidimicrobiales bacterium]
MRLGILFWFYRDVAVCQNRLRLLRRRNPGTPVYGLYGGPRRDASVFGAALGPLLDDYWSFPDDRDERWKWRNGDVMLSRWFTDRGQGLQWDSVFLAQWDLVVVSPLVDLLPPLEVGDMLISGARPVREVEAWWQWVRGERRGEYDAFLAHVAARFGSVDDPMCCQFIGLVAPRSFMARYAVIEEPELGFLEYKIPIYAQVFGTPLVPDTCFRPWWPEEPATSRATRTQSLVHAWPTPVRLPVMMYEAKRPRGRRIFHPYHGIYPHDVASLGDMLRRRREAR